VFLGKAFLCVLLGFLCDFSFYVRFCHYVDCLYVCFPHHFIPFVSCILVPYSLTYVLLYYIFTFLYFLFENSPTPFPGWMS